MRLTIVLLVLASVSLALALPEGRIVGGSNASAGQFPYKVSLRSAANSHFCGGSILNNRWTLSAAHCTVGRTNANTRVVVGTHLLNSGGVSHTVSSIVNHPNYNGNTLANDISVVQTAGTISFTASVQPLGVGSATVGGGVTAVAKGWGRTVTGGALPNNKQWKQTQTMTLAACRSAHSIINRLLVHDNTICTFTQAGQGMCNGDSGGPLVAGNVVIGAVSWGIPCAQGFPDVFARTSSHRPWIASHTGI